MDHIGGSEIGVHAVDLDGVILDGRRGAAPQRLRPGAVWRADGAPVRLAALPRRGTGQAGLRGGVTLAGPDGATWQAALVALGPGAVSGGGWLAVFEGAAPPARQELVVTRVTPPAPSRDVAAAPAHLPAALLSPDAPVETLDGPVPAAGLRPGDRLMTHAGPAPLRATRLVLSARAVVLPAGLLGGEAARGAPVSLGPRMLVGLEGQAVAALFGTPEALVRAGDLDLLPGVRRVPPRSMVALVMDGAPLIMAGGVACCLAAPDVADAALPLRRLTPAEAQIACAEPLCGLSLRVRPRGRAIEGAAPA